MFTTFFSGSLFKVILILLFLFVLSGIRIVRPTHRGLIERMGKYNRFADPGFNWVVPVIDKMYRVNTTEQMVDAEPQEIITNDNLNASVDAQVYFKVKPDEESVKNSQYNVNRVNYQIVNLARTTLRNIIGTMTLKSANSERGRINDELHKILMQETTNWGIEIVRTELKQKAEGIRQARILAAEGEAEAIRLVNDAANKYFVGNAQLLRRLETVEKSLQYNAKIVVPSNTELINVIGEMAGVLPLKRESGQDPEPMKSSVKH
jgi:regulator of protease activity HflC (stomatin/prohibitin superfamily)